MKFYPKFYMSNLKKSLEKNPEQTQRSLGIEYEQLTGAKTKFSELIWLKPLLGKENTSKG